MIESVSITGTTIILEGVKGKSIRLLTFWYEIVSNNWNGHYFAFRFGEEDKDYFRKSTTGVAAINLLNSDCVLPVGKSLKGYISGGNASVHITVLYRIV